MLEVFFQKVFKKADIETGTLKNRDDLSVFPLNKYSLEKNPLGDYLADTVFKGEFDGKPIAGRRFVRIYNAFILNTVKKRKNFDRNFLDALAVYIDYDNYSDFEVSYKKEQEDKKGNSEIPIQPKPIEKEKPELEIEKTEESKTENIELEEKRKKEEDRLKSIQGFDKPKTIHADPKRKSNKLSEEIKDTKNIDSIAIELNRIKREKEEFRKLSEEEKRRLEKERKAIIKEVEKEEVLKPKLDSEKASLKTSDAEKKGVKNFPENKNNNLPNKPQKKEEEEKKRKRFLWLFLIPIIGVISVLVYNVMTTSEKKFCMAWDTDHYVLFDCEKRDTYNDVIELEREDEFRDYKQKKKIEINENQTFFDKNNKEPIIWYQEKEYGYDFFNFGGAHPENGRMLSPVSEEFLNDYFGTNRDWDGQNKEDFEIDNYTDKSPCEDDHFTSLYCMNNSAKRIKIIFKGLYEIESYSKTIFVSSNEELFIEKIPSGKIIYSIFQASTNQFLERKEIRLEDCTLRNITFDYAFTEDSPTEETNINEEDELPIEEPVSTKPDCEINQTGEISFRNMGMKYVRVRVETAGVSTASFSTQEIEVGAKEIKNVKDMSVQNYRYKVFDNATNGLIVQGNFSIKQCETVEKRITYNEQTNNGTGTTTDSQPNNTTKTVGDICFKNNNNTSVNVQIVRSSKTSALVDFTAKIDIDPGDENCFFDVKEGVYKVWYVFGSNMSKFKELQIRVTAGQDKTIIIN